ncbi:MAG: sodium-translocating pyrophosphatase, partial [Patescibacteria group bacterium]
MFYIPIIIALFTIVFAFFLIQRLNKAANGSEKMQAIAAAIREGAMSYLKRQYTTVAIVAGVLFIILWLALGIKTGLGFIVGGLSSALAGFMGMLISTRANVKVAEAAKKGMSPALRLSFLGGSVTGLMVVGLGLLAVSGFWALFHDLKALIALGFGGSLIAVFARLGGGIYTKAADVGADLVGKVEQGIPEDDPRNPATIADNVGDNVGDCAGMAADLFETYAATLVAAMILGSSILAGEGAIRLPLMMASVAAVSSVIATFFVRLGKTKNIMNALYKGLAVSAVLAAIGFWPILKSFENELVSQGFSVARLFGASIVGLVIAGLMFVITDYYTSKKYKPVKDIAAASQTGHATNIIAGLAIGMKSTALPILVISAGILISYWLGGIYGITLAAVSMISLAGIIVAIDAYGPITDNAGGIAEMAELPKEVREVTDALDSVGNTTKAVTKGYAIASAGLAALMLFSVFSQDIAGLGGKAQFLLSSPKVLVGLFLGGLLPFYFAALSLGAVGKVAGKVVIEVRRQFKEIAGLMEGTAKPEYGKCVDIVTKAALRQMLAPALLSVLAPIVVGFALGIEALAGLLIGAIVTGLFVAISMTSGGAAWDNAKKYIEGG